MRVFWNWRERRWLWRPSVASAATAGAGDWGLGAGDWARERTSASRSGMRLRRHEVSASSWTSWVSVGVAGRYSFSNWRRWWRELLEKLSEETGGRYYKPSETSKLANEISYSEAGITTQIGRASPEQSGLV